MTNENTQINIVEYDEVANEIAEVQEVANFLPDVSSEEGYEKSKRVSLDIGKLLTALEKTRKEKKAYFLQGGKEVDKQAKEIAEQLEVLQLPHKEAYKNLDKEKAEREAKRKQAFEERIMFMVEAPNTVIEFGLASDKIKNLIDEVEAIDCGDFDEFENAAINARETSLERLNNLFNETHKREQDAIELEKLRKEQEKRDQEEREENIRKEAAKKADDAKKAALKEKEDAENAKAIAEQEKLDAEKRATKAKADAKKAAEKAKKDAEKLEKKREEERIEAEKQAKIDAEKLAEQARKDEIAKQEAAKKAEQEAIAKREANNKHVGKIRGDAKDGLMKLGCDEELAKNIVLAIHHKQIKNLSIKY